MCDDKNTSVANLRLEKGKLKNFLRKRYPPRIANKLCLLFSWENKSKSCKEFYKEVNDIFMTYNSNNNNSSDSIEH
jgi:hypothetical protein